VRAFWRKMIGSGLMFAIALMISFLVWLLVDGNRSWVVGLTAAVILLGIAMPVAVYVVHYRNSMGKFREMSLPVAEFVADDDTFTLSSDRGTTSLKWNSVSEVWRFESLWLLLFSKAQFVTLPLQDVPAPMQAFILDRVKASGGKIAV
jgi:riboflavin transporter FmnP